MYSSKKIFIPVLSALLSLLVCISTFAAFGSKVATIVMFSCVILSALYGGFIAGILVSLSTLILTVTIVDPAFASLGSGIVDSFFILSTSTLLTWVGHSLRTNKREQRKTHLRNQKSERIFKEAEERFHNALAAAHAGIYRLDLRHGTAFRNASLNKIFGLMDKEAVFPISDFKMRIHDDDQERVNSSIGRMIATKSSFSEQYRVYRSDGSTIWIKDRGMALLDENGEVEAVTGTMVDITDLVQVEESLHASQEQFRILIESIKDYGLFLLDINGNIVSWNIGAERITGFSDSEAIGEHMRTIFASTSLDSPDRTKDELNEAMEKGIWQGERWHSRKNGTNFLAQELVYPLQKNGKIYGFAKVMNDITLRKKAEDSLKLSEARFRQLLEAIPQMVFTARPDYRFDFANQRWMDYTACTQSQIANEGWQNLVEPDDLQKVQAHWREASASKSAFSHELRLRRGDGTYRWHLCRALPILDMNDEICEWFGTHTDIEEQKQLQGQLLKAKQEAEEVSHMKTAFLATVSHEIRTPLSAIIGFSRLLVEESWTEEKMKEFAQISLRNGYALSRIIDDILDLSKVEAGKLEVAKSDISLQELLSEVVESLSVKAMEKGIGVSYRIENNVPESFLSDSVRLRQILINIIGNAIKFTNEGDVQVVVEADKLNAESPTLAFFVKDTGCGISEQNASHLFQPFQQADTSTSRKYGGTGLGLALSRKLAQLLGGNVTLVNSTPDEGSTFKVELPLDGANNEVRKIPKRVEGAARSLQPAGRLKGMKILVAEDAVDTQLLIRQILSRQGAEIDFADNGKQAIERAESKDYDIILMDIQMPVCDGYQATKTLRSRSFDKPIIGLSAHAMREEHDKIIASGCNEHLAKPFDPKKLVDLIELLGSKAPESLDING